MANREIEGADINPKVANMIATGILYALRLVLEPMKANIGGGQVIVPRLSPLFSSGSLGSDDGRVIKTSRLHK